MIVSVPDSPSTPSAQLVTFTEVQTSTIIKKAYSAGCTTYFTSNRANSTTLALEYNQKLSENRAKAVVKYLVNKGIDERRLKYKGYGEHSPIDTNDTETGRINNRRVEFKILAI